MRCRRGRSGVNVKSSPIKPTIPSPMKEELATLSGGVSVHLSNSVFPQSFEKELVIDQRQVLIMTMCLIPTTFVDTRDYGLALNNPGIIHEVTSVFDTDWAYSAASGRGDSRLQPDSGLARSQPDLGPDRRDRQALAVDPVGPPHNQHHKRAARRSLPRGPVDRGSPTRCASPPDHPAEPDRGPDQCTDIAFLASEGVNVRVTVEQYPPADSLPYMHAKTMVVDGRIAYLGSIDLETNEATQDRELGVEFRMSTLVRQLNAQFQSDWSGAQTPSA